MKEMVNYDEYLSEFEDKVYSSVVKIRKFLYLLMF